MDENNHVIERNDKADLMTMSTPPHLLSAALMGNGSPEDGDTKPRRIQYNHRSEFFFLVFWEGEKGALTFYVTYFLTILGLSNL